MRRWLFLIASVACVVALSCGPDQTEDPNLVKVRDVRDTCQAALSAGKYADAREAAKKAFEDSRMMAVDDVALDQVRFCFTTANTLQRLNDLTNQLSEMLSTAVGVLNGNQGGLSLTPREMVLDWQRYVELHPQAGGIIAAVLKSFIDPVQTTLEENQRQLEEIRKRNRFQMEIPALPIKIANLEIIDAGGRYDMGEINLLYGLTRTILSSLYLVQSIDYTVNFSKPIDYFLNAKFANGKSLIDVLTERPIGTVLNLIAVILSTSPTFLDLDKAIGAELMNKAGDGFSKGFGSVLEAVNAMKKRTASVQSRHVVEYKRDEAKKQDVFVLHIKFKQNPLPFIDLNKLSDIEIPLREDIKKSMANLRDSFAGASGVRANLQRDIFPMVALVAVVLINSGAFDALIEIAMGEMDEATKAQVRSLLSLASQNQDLVTGALVSFVPVTIELDFGYVFKNPSGLRSVLPAWFQPDELPQEWEDGVTITTTLQPFTEATLVLSYECADGQNPLKAAKESLICSAAIDTGHFENIDAGVQPWRNNPVSKNFGPKFEGRIDPDGMQVISPYIGFKDATFGGLLYLDVTLIANDKLPAPEPGAPMPPATLKTLNATIASIIESVQGLFK